MGRSREKGPISGPCIKGSRKGEYQWDDQGGAEDDDHQQGNPKSHEVGEAISPGAKHHQVGLIADRGQEVASRASHQPEYEWLWTKAQRFGDEDDDREHDGRCTIVRHELCQESGDEYDARQNQPW